MSTTTYVIPPLAQMPVRGEKKAPKTFRGHFKQVTPFIDHYNHLLECNNVRTDKDKCHGILEYCSQKVKDFIQINPHYLTPNWSKLQQEILNAYDAERMDTRIRPQDFYAFIEQNAKIRIANLSQWKKYHREYIAKAGFLKQANKLNDTEYNGYYWYGISNHLQGILELHLQSKYPNHDISDPWPIQSVHEIAENYFKRNKFSSQLSHLPILGFEDDDDDDDDDSDNYFYDSFSDTDSEDDRRRR